MIEDKTIQTARPLILSTCVMSSSVKIIDDGLEDYSEVYVRIDEIDKLIIALLEIRAEYQAANWECSLRVCPHADLITEMEGKQ